MTEERGPRSGVRAPREGRAGPARYCLAVAVRSLRWPIAIALALSAVFLAVLLLLRFADPPGSTLMLGRRLAGTEIAQHWVPLEAVSPALIRAVIASEDGRFCRHRGVDVAELDAAIEKAERTGDPVVRGASTITMQVAKNLFLWPGRSTLRKGLEILMALAIEQVWSKQRILEVYLNLAEWGPGVFGIEAAARHHFARPAHRLGEREAALLAVALPNPHERTAGRPGPGMVRLAGVIEARARLIGPRIDCIPLLTRGRAAVR
jgi:monofunctional biosynthetic peptidoglycan transglycosylase